MKTREHTVKEFDMATHRLRVLGTFDSFGIALRYFEAIEPEPKDKWRYIYSIGDDGK